MRDDYAKYVERKATIVVVARHDAETMRDFWARHKLPYIGIPDPEGKIGELYGQQWRALKFGLMPALFVIDQNGRIALAQYGDGMSDIPSNKAVLEIIDNLKK